MLATAGGCAIDEFQTADPYDLYRKLHANSGMGLSECFSCSAAMTFWRCNKR